MKLSKSWGTRIICNNQLNSYRLLVSNWKIKLKNTVPFTVANKHIQYLGITPQKISKTFTLNLKNIV